ncbi:MAG: hypothetical protein KDC13_00580 [Bacteroidetes bacterium]|nr:hypothetical protein [Bacteroidota bacterium]
MRYYLNSTLFSVLLICFFLPFIEIKCNSNSLGSMSGYAMITGGDMKLSDASMMDYLNENDQFKSLNEKRKNSNDVFTLIAAVLLFLGAVLSLVLKTFREQLAIILSLLVLLILLVFRWVMLHQWASQMESQAAMFSYIKLTLNFVIGFWLVVTGTILIAGLNTFYLFQNRKRNMDIVDFHDEGSPDLMSEV